MIEGSVFPPMTNERILIMKRILFCISLRFIMASFFVHVTLSEPVVKFFMKFSNNIEEVAWFLIVWFLIVEWFFTLVVTTDLVLCQDLVQVKMRNFSHFNPPEAQPQCVFFYTIVRIHLVTYSYNGYEFVSYCRKLPDIRKSSGMPACNREF